MRARLTLILTIAAACIAVVPMTPVHAAPADDPRLGWFSASTRVSPQQLQAVAQLRHAERARLSAVAKALTTPPASGRSSAAAMPPSSFIWPATGPIGSRFGRRWGRPHQGIDIDAPNHSPIVAAQAGVVTLSGWKDGYGNTVIIDHGNGVNTLYAHQSRLVARSGEHVAQGQLIGYVGSTGNVTAPHLHYEVHINGVPRDPMPWL
jgi:murein DD-endopeptidase MepM/ murein hydrolase activator NlpD